AQRRQPDVQRVVDRVSGVFVPAVIVNAVFWTVVWYAEPSALYGVSAWLGGLIPVLEPVGGGPVGAAAGGVSPFEFSIVVLASAILIACPCALGLATPMATMVGSTLSAKNAVLYAGADVLERARDVDTVVFDKTGTLTRGEMTVTDVESVGGRRRADGGVSRAEATDESHVLRMAAAAETASEHPLGRAVVEAARERGLEVPGPTEFESVPGRGVRAVVEESKVHVGNRRLMEDAGVDVSEAEAAVERLETEGKTAVYVAVDGALAGVVAESDVLRDSAFAAVDELRRRGLDVRLLTGDNRRTAYAVARELGLDDDSVDAEVLPDDKADAVDRLQDGGRKVMMVGDGVNDAPALTTAHVGVAIGSGTDVALESADVTLMRDDPLDVVKALRIATATMQKVRQNLFWAFAYNATLIPVASLGLLNPALAGVAMAFSSVSVVSNSLSFMRWNPDEDYSFLPFRLLRR
ncbi:MAG: heavy metal translocating P-type ATPase, partial [Halobacteriota archaeon]